MLVLLRLFTCFVQSSVLLISDQVKARLECRSDQQMAGSF